MIENFDPDNIVVFFGKTGVGKTSTINLLFEQDWAIDNAKACTKSLQYARHKPKGKEELLIIDIPGISESEIADKLFFKQYIKAVSNANNIVWMFQGDTRVYRPDQVMLLKLKNYLRNDLNFTICLNQIDLIGEADWDLSNNKPSSIQEKFIQEKKIDIISKFSKYISNLKKDNIIAHSALHKYNSIYLYDKIINMN